MRKKNAPKFRCCLVLFFVFFYLRTLKYFHPKHISQVEPNFAFMFIVLFIYIIISSYRLSAVRLFTRFVLSFVLFFFADDFISMAMLLHPFYWIFQWQPSTAFFIGSKNAASAFFERFFLLRLKEFERSTYNNNKYIPDFVFFFQILVVWERSFLCVWHFKHYFFIKRKKHV